MKSGTVIVQHNLLQAVSTSVLTNVIYGDASCCFPTSGTTPDRQPTRG